MSTTTLPDGRVLHQLSTLDLTDDEMIGLYVFTPATQMGDRCSWTTAQVAELDRDLGIGFDAEDLRDHTLRWAEGVVTEVQSPEGEFIPPSRPVPLCVFTTQRGEVLAWPTYGLWVER